MKKIFILIISCYTFTFIFAQSNKGDMRTYEGDYCRIDYPKQWSVNETPGTYTADVFIGFNNGVFGVWLFRFEDDKVANFKDAMEDVAKRWKEFARVDVSYVMINGAEWCKQDIQMKMQGEECRQISYYRQEGGYVYNVKFGNRKYFVDIGIPIINEMMKTFKIL